MVHRIRRRVFLFGAAVAPVLAQFWTTPAQAAPAPEGLAPAAAGDGAAQATGLTGRAVFAVQRGLVWRTPIHAAGVSGAERSGIAVVRGGTRDQLSVQVRLTRQEMVLPTRDFAPGWQFAPGDLVLVQVRSNETVIEPLQRVVPGETGTEIWAPNLTQGPRVAAVVA